MSAVSANWANDGAIDILINGALNAANSCYVQYSQAENTLTLIGNDGVTPLPSITPGSGSQQNSQCILNGSSSFASLSGTTLTVTFGLTFLPAFNVGSGQQTVYAVASDGAGENTELQPWATIYTGNPDFTISVSPPTPTAIVAGSPATYNVTAASIPGSGFTGAVTLTAPGLPAGATAIFSPQTVTIPTPGSSATSTMTLTTPVSLTANVVGSAAGAALVHTAAVPVTVQDFTLAVSPTSSLSVPLIVAAGQTVTFTVSTAALGGNTTPINLGLSIPLLQTCSTCIGLNLSEGSVNPGGSVNFSWVVPSNTWGGTYTYSIGGTSPGLSHSVTGQVTVAPQDFTVTVVQSPVQTISSPGSGSFTMSVTSINNFAGNVAFGGLSWQTTVNGVPANLPQVTLTAGGTATVQFGINLPAGLSAGQTEFSIGATSGSLTHAANCWITVGSAPSSTLSIASTHSGSFSVGQPASYTVTVTNQPGAGATSGTVTVTDNLPAGLALASSMSGTGWTCSSNTCTRSDSLSGGASYPPIAVPVNVALNAPTQVYNQVSVTGPNSQAASSLDLTTIQGSTSPPDFTLKVTQNPQTVAPGGTAAYSISVNPLGGFGSTAVSLSMGAIAGVTASVSPSAQSGAPAKLTLTASPTIAFGTIPVMIAGSSGATTHYTVANLRVAPVAPASIVTPPPGQFIPGGATTFTWNTGNGASQFTLTVGSTPGAADLYSGSPSSSQSASMTLPGTMGQTVYATLNSSTPAGVALTPQTYAYTISTQGISSGLTLASGPVANVNANSGEVAYTYTFRGGDARAMTECVPTADVVTIRLIQQTATTATLGFTPKPGPFTAFDFSCGCPGSGHGEPDNNPPVIDPNGVSPATVQTPTAGVVLQISGENFGDPSEGAEDTVDICSTSTGACSSVDTTPESDTLIILSLPTLQSGNYTISVSNDAGESNAEALGVSAPAQPVYDTPPTITALVPGDIPASAGQLVAIQGTNLGSAGNITICQGTNCLPYTIPDLSWTDTEVDVVVDATAAAPGTAYTVSLSTTLTNLGSAFASAPGSAPDSTSASLEIDPAPAPVGCPTSITLSVNTPLSLQAGLPAGTNFPTYLTGVGSIATMQANPIMQNLTGTYITEMVSLTSNSCPSGISNQCPGSSTWTLGVSPPPPAPGQLIYGSPYPPLATNQFFDLHTSLSPGDLLNGVGVNSCTMVCAQTYYCKGAAISNFTITRTFTHTSIGGTPVTVVKVDKK